VTPTAEVPGAGTLFGFVLYVVNLNKSDWFIQNAEGAQSDS